MIFMYFGLDNAFAFWTSSLKSTYNTAARKKDTDNKFNFVTNSMCDN